MKELIRKLLWLLLPPTAVIYGFPFIVLSSSGELMGVSTVVRRQMASDVQILYGVSYTNPVRALKLEALRYRAPSVVVLGTSRVMQIRSRMFRSPDRFYNAGGATANLWDLRTLLAAIPVDRQPEILVVGLDQYLFNANFAEFSKTASDTESTWREVVHQSRSIVYDDYRNSKFSLHRVFRNMIHGEERIGLNAIMNDNGFRNDGSYYYGKFIANPRGPANEDIDFKDTLERIRGGNRRFEYGRQVSAEAVEEIRAFLRMCRARRIHVVAFLPPFAHQVYERMIAMGDSYGYLHQLGSVLTPIVNAEGYSLFDFSDLASVGAPDLETIDGFHASEPAYLRLLLEMQRQDAVLERHVADAAVLRARLAAADPYVVFDNAEF